MAMDPERSWLDVVQALVTDPDDDVTASETELRVRGRLFAARGDDRLIVDLPTARAADLVERGIAEAVPSGAAAADPAGRWVAIVDADDWVELAGEAHQFVGEPRVGGES
jgi:hypothetical protein